MTWSLTSPAGPALAEGESGAQLGSSASWQRSSASHPDGDCVQVAHSQRQVWIRDSKDPDGPVLELSTANWAAFIDGVRRATLDHTILTALA